MYSEDIFSLIMLGITMWPILLIIYLCIIFTLISPVVFIFYYIKQSFLIRLVKKITKILKVKKTHYKKSYFSIIFIEHLLCKGILENKEIIINVDSKKINNYLEISLIHEIKLNHNFILKYSENAPIFNDNFITQELDKNKSAIIKLSTIEILNKIKNITENDTHLIIDDKKIFIKKENLKNQIIINKTAKIFISKIKNLILIMKALNEKIDDEIIMIKNIKKENELESRIINLSILIIYNQTKYKNLLTKLKNDQNIIISSMANIGLNEKISENIKKILDSKNKKAIYFIIYFLDNIYNKKDSSDLLLNILAKTKHPDIIIHITFILLNKKSKQITKNTFIVLIKINNLLKKEKTIKINLIKYCGKNKVDDSLIWLSKQLKKRDIEITSAVIDSYIKIDNVNAVEFLLPLTEGLYPDDIKYSAKKAIFLLQKDITNKDFGNLTLTNYESEGNLSIKNNKKTGELSFEE